MTEPVQANPAKRGPATPMVEGSLVFESTHRTWPGHCFHLGRPRRPLFAQSPYLGEQDTRLKEHVFFAK